MTEEEKEKKRRRKNHRKKIKKARNWCTKNKVFFEIFSFLFLGIASIIVAALSYSSSQGQLELLKLEHSPIINVQREFKGDYEFLEIHNIGYHLFQPNISYSTYYVVNSFNDSIVNYKSDFYFKIGDYFGLNYETENTTGIISTISSSPYMRIDSKRISSECKDLFGDNFRASSFEHLLKINYLDESKNKIFKYYWVDSFSIIEVSKTQYEKKESNYESHNLSGHKYLNTIKGSEILLDIRKIYIDVIKPILIEDGDI